MRTSTSSVQVEMLEPGNTDYLIPEIEGQAEDTGVRTTHADFGGRARPALDMISGSVDACAEEWQARPQPER